MIFARCWWRFAAGALLCAGLPSAAAEAPKFTRIFPLGGQAGTTVTVEILGERLSNVTAVEFDCADLAWKKTTYSGPGKLAGEVAVAAAAPLGPHTLRAVTQDGPTNSLIFNVGQFPSVVEAEPNNGIASAQPLATFPAEIQGRLDGAPDMDIYSFEVRAAGERRVFDLRSIEDGSAVEARMILLDGAGKPVRFNDDRDDYNENPLIEHTFGSPGRYYVKLDQYRGPRGFNFGKLNVYTLRMSALPVARGVQPLTLRRGAAETTVRVTGTGLAGVRSVYLTELRLAENARMTYPFTVPIRFSPDPRDSRQLGRIEGRVIRTLADGVDAAFSIPATARVGLWALWVSAPGAGVSRAVHIDVSDGEGSFSGAISRPGERDTYRFEGRAGQTLHVWTLAAQLGVQFLDTVLTLRDGAGKKLAESDDVVAGQGTLLGNPDSSLYYTPEKDGPLVVEVRDRLRRGGASGFEYCLKSANERPGFQLFTTPENFAVARGESGEFKVHLVREAGFQGEVDVWIEGLPPGVESPKAQFRADQLFEPNADGADMIIPEIPLRLTIPESVPVGLYSFRVLGAPAREKQRVVEARASLMLGPLLDIWNYVRRPLPAINLAVIAPSNAVLTTKAKTVRVERGGEPATLELTAENLPESVPVRLLDLPPGVEYKVLGRQGTQVTVAIEATHRAETGSFEVSAEAESAGRRTASPSITLVVAAGAK